MKRALISLLLIVFVLPISFLNDLKPAQAAYNPGNLIADNEFTNWSILDANGIQAFLNTKGGTRLRTFRENNLSAAQIIANAARANGVNPFVILATIQKEESLVDSNTNFDYRVTWAMGYGVCDSCSLDDPDVVKYRGFTNQINNGTWQLKRNYSYWAGNGSAWNVGKTMVIDDTAVRFGTRGTSALYRYTPHLGGNLNFYNIYNRYKTFRGSSASGGGIYSASFYGQYQGNRVINLRPGQRRTIYARYRNTGTDRWDKTGANAVHLGTSNPQDRSSVFTGGNIRWQMTSSSAKPNKVATFRTTITAPSQPGIYTEKFQPVAEGITWMGEEVTFTFNVGGQSLLSSNAGEQTYSASFYDQYQGNKVINLRPGQHLTIYARYRNTGTARWDKTGANATHLGTSDPQDRTSIFTGGNTRWQMISSSVKSGGVAKFTTTITAPSTPGTYTEKFQPVAEGITWMGPEVTFTFKVQ